MFAEVEKILYKKYPEYGVKFGEDNLFLCNGGIMRRIMTMAENGFPGYSVCLTKNNS